MTNGNTRSHIAQDKTQITRVFTASVACGHRQTDSKSDEDKKRKRQTYAEEDNEQQNDRFRNTETDKDRQINKQKAILSERPTDSNTKLSPLKCKQFLGHTRPVRIPRVTTSFLPLRTQPSSVVAASI